MTTRVYTDGACIGNPGPGGWAWAVPDGPYVSGAEAATTNQRMEVRAALSALQTLQGPLEVISDSQYVVNCFNDRWYVTWEAKGWRNSKKVPVANQDLWKPMVELFHVRERQLTFTWVKGHSDDRWNDVVDRLATEAALTQTGRAGTQPPTTLGPADRAAGQPAGISEGYRAVIVGHRPPELGGYDDNPIATEVRRKLTEILAGLRVLHPDAVVLTGLGLGAEQLGAEAAIAAGVPYIAVLAFPDFDEKWPSASRAAYRRLLDGAADSVVVSKTKPSSKQAAGMAIGRRRDWLVSHADCALVVWDRHDRELRDTVRVLEARIPEDVWVVEPPPNQAPPRG